MNNTIIATYCNTSCTCERFLLKSNESLASATGPVADEDDDAIAAADNNGADNNNDRNTAND
jgi:hypothetical protein